MTSERKLTKGNINILLSEYAMHSYGIRLITVCAIEIKISSIQSKCTLEQNKSSIALIVNMFVVLQLYILQIVLVLSIHSAK